MSEPSAPPPAATSAVSFAPAAPVETPPAPDDRILVGAAYLSVLVGLWFFAPLALYFWKGKGSRFVAFHAMQAMLLHLSMIPITVGGHVLAFVAETVLGAVLHQGDRSFDAMDGLAFFAPMSVGTALPFCLTVWMGSPRCADARRRYR